MSFDKSEMPCLYAYRSERGCMREQCEFSHDRKLIKQACNLHECPGDDDTCKILCAHGQKMCPRHYRQSKGIAEWTPEERREKAAAAASSSSGYNNNKPIMRKCEGPNCLGFKNPSSLNHNGYCFQNGCQQLINANAPRDSPHVRW